MLSTRVCKSKVLITILLEFVWAQVQIFFSAHGVPVAYVEEAGDPYKAEMEECVELIMSEVKRRGIWSPHTLAYQVGPILIF